MQYLKTHLLGLEAALQTAEVRRSEVRLRELLAPSFREFGRSGKSYELEDILTSLTAEISEIRTAIEDFEVARLADTVALVTYRSVRFTDDGDRLFTNRSSIWQAYPDGNWRMVFHQGTPVA